MPVGVIDSWVKSPSGRLYFTVVNTGTTDDRLVSASSSLAKSADLHEMKIENNVASMNARTKRNLLDADTPAAALGARPDLEHAGSITFNVPVGSIAARTAT